MSPRSTAALVAALVLLTATPAGAQAPPQVCGSAYPIANGPVSVTAVNAQRSDGTWEDAIENLTVCVSYHVQTDLVTGPLPVAGVSLSGRRGTLEQAYPADTLFSVVLTGGPAGYPPVSATGSLQDSATRIEPQRVVLEGRPSTRVFAHEELPGVFPPTPKCDGPTTTTSAMWSASVAFDQHERAFGSSVGTGSYYHSNAQTFGSPWITELKDGTRAIEMLALGCGDHDPNTLEGFLHGFIPSELVNSVGLSPALLTQPPEVVNALIRLTDNGKVRRGQFVPRTADDEAVTAVPGAVEPGSGGEQVVGLRFEYELSYSRHRIRAGIVKSNVRAAKLCRKKNRKAYVAKGKVRCRR